MAEEQPAQPKYDPVDVEVIESVPALEKAIYDMFGDAGPKVNYEANPHINPIVPLHPNLKWRKWNPAPTTANIRNTGSYIIDKLHFRVIGCLVKDGKLKKVLKIKNETTPKQYIPYFKQLSKDLKWPGVAQGMRLDENFWKHKDIRIMGCILKRWSQKDKGEDEVDVPGYLNDFYGRFMSSVSQKYPLPDGFYIISPTDQVVLRKDGKEPVVDVVGGLIPLKSHNFAHYYPIMNSSTHVDYADIPLPTYDDWMFVRGKTLQIDQVELDWNKKKPMAVFRGSSSGCGFNEKTNMRIKAAALSKAYPDLLDAGMNVWTVQAKMHRTGRLGYIDRKKYKETVPSIPFAKQSEFKYLLHIDGNVAAYRLGVSLLLGSCILYQETGSRVWFQHLMKPYVHYIPIKEDLSDLIETIKWCREHDEECRKIAGAALELGQRILTKDSLIDYFAATMWAIADSMKHGLQQKKSNRTRRSGSLIKSFRKNNKKTKKQNNNRNNVSSKNA